MLTLKLMIADSVKTNY